MASPASQSDQGTNKRERPSSSVNGDGTYSLLELAQMRHKRRDLKEAGSEVNEKRPGESASFQKHAKESFHLLSLPGAAPQTSGSFSFAQGLWSAAAPPPELAVAMNFLVDLPYFDALCAPWRLARRKVVVAPAGDRARVAPYANAQENLTWFHPEMPDAFGCHHAKCLMLFSKTGMRLVVHTANYCKCDCQEKVQGAFVQDFPRRQSNSNSSVEDTFRDTLVSYVRELDKVISPVGRVGALGGNGLAAVGSETWMGFQNLAELLAHHDFTGARADLTASVPGRHTGPNFARWGSKAIARLLRRYGNGRSGSSAGASSSSCSDPWANEARIVAQCSSLGSIPETLLHEIEADLRGGGGGGGRGFSLVWPRVSEVAQCREGWNGGNSIPGKQNNVVRNHLTTRMCQFWDVAVAAPKPAVPHIKTYCRVSSDGKRLAWAWLTSANLSGAALGKAEKKNTQVFIRHFEMGVLFTAERCAAYASLVAAGDLRSSFQADVAAPRTLGGGGGGGAKSEPPALIPTQHAASSTNACDVLVPLPYPLPPRPYLKMDRPWYTDGAAENTRDRNGHTQMQALQHYQLTGHNP